MLVVTTNDIPGWEIQRVCGEVFGLTVRSRNVFSNIGASFKSLGGGELQGMTKNLIDSRNEVMGRMLDSARARGGNAVIGMRFDTSEMGDVWTEICAYGTAVVAIPVTDAAKQTAIQLGYGQPGGSPATANPVQPPPPQGPPRQGPPPQGPPAQAAPQTEAADTRSDDGEASESAPQGPPSQGPPPGYPQQPGYPPGYPQPGYSRPQGYPQQPPGYPQPGQPPQGYPQQYPPR
jgi:uncharacterized protein YbjQ (UPF0145 family)